MALYFATRAENLAFLKRLWTEQETPCPRCGTVLTTLHRKAKRSNADWRCPGCGEVFRTIHLLDELNETMKN